MNLNTRYKYSSKWDRIPPQAGKELTDPHHGVNNYTDHLEMLQDIAYTRDVYKQISSATARAWLAVLGLKGGIEMALYQKWFRSFEGWS
jgi:hypothetical protein